MNYINKLITAYTFAALSLLITAKATTLSDFNNGDLTGIFSNTWSGSLTQNGTFATISGPATDFGDYKSPTFTAIDITGQTNVTVRAKLEAGNTSTGFTVNLISGPGSAVASAYFDATLFNSTNFTTASITWVNGGIFNSSNLRAWQITGGSPTSTTNFRISYDNLSTSAIPEPATYAALFGLGGLGLAAFRRRRTAA
jgi:hypothetical protein